MARIDVQHLSDFVYQVTVDDGSKTVHEVTLAADNVEEFGAPDAETLLRESFEFLLEREPKESILRSFELSVIGRYFPEYEDEMRSKFC